MKLEGKFQNNNGLSNTIGLIPLNIVRVQDPPPLIEMKRSYSSAARRGVLGKMAFEITNEEGRDIDPTLGEFYKSSVVYSRELSS